MHRDSAPPDQDRLGHNSLAPDDMNEEEMKYYLEQLNSRDAAIRQLERQLEEELRMSEIASQKILELTIGRRVDEREGNQEERNV